MKFVDEAIIDVAAGDGGNGCVSVPPREVHAVRRPERRRRRPRRQRLRGGRPQPQHAGRLPLRAPPRGAATASTARGSDHVRRRRRRHRAAHAGRHDHHATPRPARCIAELLEPGEKVADRQGRRRRLRQPALQEQHQPRAAPEDARLAGRAEEAEARAEGAGRRRPARHAERRQVDADRRDLERAAEDRRLSVHDAASEPRRGARRARAELRRSPTFRA